MLKRLAALMGVLVTGAAGAGIAVLATAVPAQAAGCSGAHGVTVVVDANQVGGTQVGCASGGGRTATSATTAAGFALTYVQRSPGFVCRIAGVPAADPCVNTPPSDAYWGLFWNDGKGGGWVYASLGAGSLSVPDGGYVGWSWQGGGARTSPGVSPTPRNEPSAPAQPTRTPTTSPTKSPTVAPTASSSPSATSASSPNGSQSAVPSASASRKPRASSTTSSARSTSASASASDSASPDGATSTDAALAADVPDAGDPTDSGGLPLWSVGAVIAVLLAGAATVAVVRRRGDHAS
ncbi:hypothetical protein [Nocardioides sp.]|uniref:hypothetical protein n=1 Tax=Nocardioides sp. TaxID=35761 RepID=UPI003D147ECE